MAETAKIKRAALAALAIIGAILLTLVAQQIISFSRITGGWNAVTVTNYIVGLVITVASLAIGAGLLWSIRRGETPFTRKNVVKLKAAAIILVLFEPYYLASQYFMHKYFPIILADNTTVVTKSSLGGMIIAAGLVVYCVALVFEYGVSIQRQIDETL